MKTIIHKLTSYEPILIKYNFPLATLVEDSEGNTNYTYPEGIRTTHPFRNHNILVRKELKNTSIIIEDGIIYI